MNDKKIYEKFTVLLPGYNISWEDNLVRNSIPVICKVYSIISNWDGIPANLNTSAIKLNELSKFINELESLQEEEFNLSLQRENAVSNYLAAASMQHIIVDAIPAIKKAVDYI